MAILIVILVVLVIGFAAGVWWVDHQHDQALSTTRAIMHEQAQILEAAQRINRRAFIAQRLMELGGRPEFQTWMNRDWRPGGEHDE